MYGLLGLLGLFSELSSLFGLLFRHHLGDERKQYHHIIIIIIIIIICLFLYLPFILWWFCHFRRLNTSNPCLSSCVQLHGQFKEKMHANEINFFFFNLKNAKFLIDFKVQAKAYRRGETSICWITVFTTIYACFTKKLKLLDILCLAGPVTDTCHCWIFFLA